MTSSTIKLVLFILIATLVTLPALAQHGGGGQGGGRGGGCGGGNGNNNGYFDPDTVATFSGTLVSAAENWEPYGHGNHTGDAIHYRLSTSSATYELMLGNYYYLVDQGLTLKEGDKVTVTGSVVDPYRPDAQEYQYLIASEINGIALRDEDGYPLWSRGGRGGGRGDRPGGGGNGRGFDEHYFDPDTVRSFNGAITEELGFWNARGHGNHTGNGMHYVFTANNGSSFYAMFGPYWFLEQNGIELEEGLKLSLTGSVIEPFFSNYNDNDYIIVTEVTVGSTTVQIRDKNGYPLWRGTGSHYHAPSYSTANTTRVNGEVTAVRTRSNGAGLDQGVELKVRGDNGKRYRVYVAPEYYTEMIGFSLARREQVRILGSVDGKSIVVRAIIANGQRWTFRDKKGNPAWEVGSDN